MKSRPYLASLDQNASGYFLLTTYLFACSNMIIISCRQQWTVLEIHWRLSGSISAWVSLRVSLCCRHYRYKRWSSSCWILPGGWSILATKTSSTGTWLLETACKLVQWGTCNVMQTHINCTIHWGLLCFFIFYCSYIQYVSVKVHFINSTFKSKQMELWAYVRKSVFIHIILSLH